MKQKPHYCPAGERNGRERELTFVDTSNVRHLANDDNDFAY